MASSDLRSEAANYARVKHLKLNSALDYYVAVRTREYITEHGKPRPGSKQQVELNRLTAEWYIEFVTMCRSSQLNYESQWLQEESTNHIMSTYA